MKILYFTRSIKVTLLLLLCVCVNGCGFHLRGLVNTSPPWLNNVAIITQQAHQGLEPQLKDQLEASHILINPDPSLASYWLIIESETLTQHITSVSSSTTPRQYQLVYTLLFKLQQAKGKELLSLHPIIVTRQITSNSNRILGSNEEELLIKEEMRRDAVLQIINRIQRVPFDGH